MELAYFCKRFDWDVSLICYFALCFQSKKTTNKTKNIGKFLILCYGFEVDWDWAKLKSTDDQSIHLPANNYFMKLIDIIWDTNIGNK